MMAQKVIIIGSGMAGCFMGICLAKKGCKVEVYEKNPDPRKSTKYSGRSFNITLYLRGIRAMQKIGIWKDVKKYAVLAEGNVAHYSEKRTVFSPFHTQGEEVLYTIHRQSLNKVLIDVASLNGVKFIFNTTCIAVNKSKKQLKFTKGKREFDVSSDIVIGADGTNSFVRSEIEKNTSVKSKRVYEDWGYKEVHVTEKTAKQLKLKKNSTHTWPRDKSLLIAFPNPDKTFTLMFNLPLEGKESFATLITKEKIVDFITHNFPSLEILLPEIINSFLNKPTGTFSTIYAPAWHYKNFIFLIGDSAHAVIPFYGQGVCAAFEDCLTIIDLIDVYKNNWGKIFKSYQKIRKEDTDVLANLSKENFIELRDRSRSAYHILKDKTDSLLNRIFPSFWYPPLYVMIAHGTLPYKEALGKKRKQERLVNKLGINLLLKLISFPLSFLQN